MSSSHPPPTELRTKITRHPERGHFDRENWYSICDQALMCHVAFQWEMSVRLLPTAHWRIDNQLFIHGSTRSGMMMALATGLEATIAISLLDDLVLARSAFHHSMNYRSLVLFSRAREILDLEEKNHVLRVFMDKLVPGRWDQVRQPSNQELKATTILAFPIEEASAKIRVGPPVDAPQDESLPVWAGTVALNRTLGTSQADQFTAPHQSGPEDCVPLWRRLD